jgi:hypothetical protein
VLPRDPFGRSRIGGIVPGLSANNVGGPARSSLRRDRPALGRDGVAGKVRMSKPIRFKCSPKTEALIVDRLRLWSVQIWCRSSMNQKRLNRRSIVKSYIKHHPMALTAILWVPLFIAMVLILLTVFGVIHVSAD